MSETSPDAPSPASARRPAWRTFFRRLTLLAAAVLFLLAAAVLSAPKPPKPHAAEALAIDRVNVVDVRTGTLRTEQTVLIDGGRIEAVGPTGFEIPSHYRRLDADGRFLIPGLLDMHAHWVTSLAPQVTMPLFLAHGVTGIRELGGDPSFATKALWRDEVNAGRLLGPRTLSIASRVVNALPSEDTAEAVEWVVNQAAERGGFVKVYNRLLPEHYEALVTSARKRGVEVVGHRPAAISTVVAARAGQRSVEHARLFLFEAFTGADELRGRQLARLRGEPVDGPMVDTALRRRMIDDFDPQLFEEITGAMVENGMAYVPTHLTRKMDAFADDEAYRNDPRLRYIHFALRRYWHEDADGMVAEDPSPEGRQVFMDFYRRGLELTGEAHRRGVLVLAGTDANDTYVFPGSSLHEELGELVKAGLTPAEALRAATLDPATFLGFGGELGHIDVGYRADLVLLRANPLDDIAATASIDAVVLGGAHYDRTALDALLKGVERGSSSVRLLLKYLADSAFAD
ncbi:MAG: amidohydrolase family protein [Acidobacteriota bacterium]